MSYDMDQNTVVDSTRGKLLTDVQMSVDEVPMVSTTQQMALNDVTSHDIASILERPVNLGTYSWSSTTEQLSTQLSITDYNSDKPNYLKMFNFPQDIFSNSTLVVDKLKNYQYLKADIEIEVKINAQPFLQGALMLVYNPYYNQTSDFRRKGTRFLASQTSCPYKIVSIEEGNSLKLTCPYANIYDLFDLANSDNQFGTVFLYVFSALKGSEAPTEVKYTVFARFVNPRFYVPTQNDVISRERDIADLARLKKRGKLIAQSAVGPVAAQDTGEVTTQGPVTKVAKGITMVADVLSGVPLIGKVASSVAWVSRAIGRTAAVMGLSKPTPIADQQKRIIKPVSTMIHTEGADDSTTLALIQDNGVDGSSMIPESKDEMALSYIFGRPNYFHNKTASSTLFSARKLITKWEVSPFSEYQYGEATDTETLYLGSFAYASMMGTLWRGTLNFDIMVIKTPFHQGRFAVVYLPETNMEDVPAELGDLLNTNYNVVCNLKDRQDEMGRTTFRVSVPFISNTPWRQTYKRVFNATTEVPTASTLDTKTGCLAIYSLVDLVNPPTVAAEVSFFVAHSGGEDYQIARPTMQIGPGFPSLYDNDVPTLVAQSDVGPVIIPEDENLLVPSHKQTDVTAQTTGEYFESLRALMKRFSFVSFLRQQSDFVGMRTRKFSEDPTNGVRTFPRSGQQDRVAPTIWYLISFLYRFYNGSSSLKIIPPTPGATGEAYLRYDETQASQIALKQRDTIAQPIFQQLQQVSNGFEIRTPFYRGIRADVVASKQVAVLDDVRTCVRVRDSTGYGSTTNQSTVFEAAGDDYNFFFLVGPPPMMDIRTYDKVTPLPSGVSLTLNLVTVSATVLADDRISFEPVNSTPDTPDAYSSTIASSSVAQLPLIKTGGGSDQVSLVDCILVDTGGSLSIRTPVLATPEIYDLTATATQWAGETNLVVEATYFTPDSS